jgi:hypothetical protein
MGTEVRYHRYSGRLLIFLSSFPLESCQVYPTKYWLNDRSSLLRDIPRFRSEPPIENITSPQSGNLASCFKLPWAYHAAMTCSRTPSRMEHCPTTTAHALLASACAVVCRTQICNSNRIELSAVGRRCRLVSLHAHAHVHGGVCRRSIPCPRHRDAATLLQEDCCACMAIKICTT